MPNHDAIFSDLSAAYRKAVKAFYDAGCRYLQFDDTAWAYLCSDVEMKKAKERGMNTATIVDDYTRVINDSIKDKPADMVITTHVCRGNFRSTWISSGGYEPVAEQMLGACNYDGYFLEYDSERAGGFEPLRFLPKGKKIAVVGVITSKSGTLESKDTVKRRIDEASKFAPLEQLALEPAVRFRQHGRRQRADRGAAVGQDARSGRGRRRDLGEVAVTARRRHARRHCRA